MVEGLTLGAGNLVKITARSYQPNKAFHDFTPSLQTFPFTPTLEQQLQIAFIVPLQYILALQILQRQYAKKSLFAQSGLMLKIISFQASGKANQNLIQNVLTRTYKLIHRQKSRRDFDLFIIWFTFFFSKR